VHKPAIHLLVLENVAIYEQLQIEEALLRADMRNFCIFNTGSPPAVVLGISGKIEELVNSSTMERAPLPMIRRFSGGGTVVIDQSSCFISFIANSHDVSVKCCPGSIHNFAIEIYQKSFPDIALQLLENDYIIGEKKYGGNAQYLCKDRWLHHTSFLWDYSDALMDYLLLPKKMPNYRNKRTHSAFLGKLCEHLPSKEEFFSSVVAALHERYSLIPLPFHEVAAALDLPHRKATTLL
jgi:lipoate-protein ligase A